MNARKIVRRIHLFTGLTLGLVLVSSGLTGSILVFRHQIDRALHPELLHVTPGASRIPLQAVIEQVAARYPGTALSRIRLPRADDESYEVITAGEDQMQIYVDPYRGTVLGARGARETFANAVFQWHRALLSGKTGERVLGTLGLLSLLLLISGIATWWQGVRRVRDALLVKWSAGWKRANYDVHRAVGIWSSLLLVVAVATGPPILFPNATRAVLDAATFSRPPVPPAPAVPLPGAAPLPVDRLLHIANAALPGGRAAYVILPARPGEPLKVLKRLDGEVHPNGRSLIYLHPQTGRVLGIDNALRAPLGTRVFNLLFPIHTGDWAGEPIRYLYALLGLAPLILFASGLWIWRLRSRGPARREDDGRRSNPRPGAAGASVGGRSG